jgi:uncharacterized protein
MSTIIVHEPLANATLNAIRSGNVDVLKSLLAENPGLANAQINGRTLLHVSTDWPGHFPRVAETIDVLIAAGADPNVQTAGKFEETPLHWAASSDDVEAIDALLAGGANIEMPGASIAGGTPLDDAVGYGQWNAARRLVERGAKVEKLWHAAALGMMPLVERHFAAADKPSSKDISDAFWQACHGGQLPAAKYLLEQGADINWIPDWAKERPIKMARASGNEELVQWLLSKDAKSADE